MLSTFAGSVVARAHDFPAPVIRDADAEWWSTSTSCDAIGEAIDVASIIENPGQAYYEGDLLPFPKLMQDHLSLWRDCPWANTWGPQLTIAFVPGASPFWAEPAAMIDTEERVIAWEPIEVTGAEQALLITTDGQHPTTVSATDGVNATIVSGAIDAERLAEIDERAMSELSTDWPGRSPRPGVVWALRMRVSAPRVRRELSRPRSTRG